MDFYIDKKSTYTIYDEDLISLGKHLKEFVNVYLKHIYVSDPIHGEILRRLDTIAELLINRQYDQLFDNSVIIDYNSKPFEEIDDDDLPF